MLFRSPGSRPIVAYAHSVFATFCELNVPATASTRPSSALIIPAPGFRPIFAYAHSVFAMCRAVNVTATASARPSSSLITAAPGARPIVAYAHSVFASSCAGTFKAQEVANTLWAYGRWGSPERG